MTLMYENKLKIVNMYVHTEKKLSQSRLSKVRTLQIDRQDDRHPNVTRHAANAAKASPLPLTQGVSGRSSIHAVKAFKGKTDDSV